MSLSVRSSSVRLGLLAALALAPGCRSATQTDLIERELRQQEDQIYALQDYLADYERVLCQVRSENAALRQALARRELGDELPTPSGREPTPPRNRPSPPAADGLPDEAVPIVPDVPPLDLPDVPPPDTSSSNDDELGEPNGEALLADDVAPPPANPPSTSAHDGVRGDAQPQAEPDVLLAAGEEPVFDDRPAPATSIAVLGEVAERDRASGPRVLVQVVPLSADGESTPFDGEISLMFLVPHADGPRELARWDFSSQELPEFVRRSDAGIVFEFPLQLPATPPANAPAELWVRLRDAEGGKILSQTPVDLDRPGRFASGAPSLHRSAAQTGMASSVEPTSATMPAMPRTREENGWQIAVPGLVQSASSAAASQPPAKWRRATQPIPVVASQPPQPDPLDAPLDSFEPYDRCRVQETVSAAPGDLPTWSPKRAEVTPRDTLSAPAWAPTR